MASVAIEQVQALGAVSMDDKPSWGEGLVLHPTQSHSTLASRRPGGKDDKTQSESLGEFHSIGGWALKSRPSRRPGRGCSGLPAAVSPWAAGREGRPSAPLGARG